MPCAQSCVITNHLRGEDHTRSAGESRLGALPRTPAGPIPGARDGDKGTGPTCSVTAA